MNRPVLVLSLVAAVGIVFPAGATQTQNRTIYLSALDAARVPVPALQLTDVSVTENGQPRRVVRVDRASEPAKLAMIVDEHELWTGSVRAAVTDFVKRIPDRWQVGLFSAERPEWSIADFTSDRNVVLRAIQQFAPITLNHDQNNVHLEALVQDLSTQFRKKEIARPIIVSMGPQPSVFNWDLVIKDVLRSHTTVFAAATRESGRLIQGSIEATGGRSEIVLTEFGMVDALNRIGDDIIGQLALTYESSMAPKDGFRVQVTVNQPNIDVRAPERVY